MNIFFEENFIKKLYPIPKILIKDRLKINLRRMLHELFEEKFMLVKK